MRITTKCPLNECRVSNTIEIEEPSIEVAEGGIPAPSVGRSGVIQLSLTHPGHTLIIDVDANGTVRKYLTVPKIDTIVDHYTATVANRIRQNHSKLHTLLIITEDKNWQNFFVKSGAAFLGFDDIDEFSIISKKDRLEITLDKFTVMITKNLAILSELNSNVSLIIEEKLIKEALNSIMQNISIIDIIGIALDEKRLLSSKKPLDADIIVSNLDVASVFYMVPDEESIGLFSLEILDHLPF
ncbi:MAG: hypothetical protein ACW99A_04885 [Candidatus Kariarchaeaceae archaeon]